MKHWIDLFRAREQALIEDVRALVEHESPSDDSKRVSALSAWVRDRLVDRGVRAETVPCPPNGDAVLARSAGAGATLLLGHLDTVWPVGTLAERPFRIEDGRATGPGVFDMKAGAAVAMAVSGACAGLGGAASVSLLLVADEEIGTAASRDLLLSVARSHRQVLVLEPSLAGAVKIARKGTGLFEVSFRGRSAHAGLEPERGASALRELAHCALALEALGDVERGTTVTPTVAASGSKTNVVPAQASLSVDCRVWNQVEARRVEDAVRAYVPRDPRVAVSVTGGFDRPPLEPTPASQALYEKARRHARALGFELAAARVGGASDGNLTAAAGVPTLDGLGPRGDGAHARHEFIEIDDLAVRAALVAAIATDAS